MNNRMDKMETSGRQLNEGSGSVWNFKMVAVIQRFYGKRGGERGAISLGPRLQSPCENPRCGTVICRFGRVACPRSSVALSTFSFSQVYLRRSLHMTAVVLIAGERTLCWSGGKPPFRTCELAGLESF